MIKNTVWEINKEFLNIKMNKMENQMNYLVEVLFNKNNIKDLSEEELKNITMMWKNTMDSDIKQMKRVLK